MTKLLSLLFTVGLLQPATASVSIEFQFGAIRVPAGSVGVLVADVDGDGFYSPAAADPDTALTAGETIGTDDVIVTVFSETPLSDWGAGTRGFADRFAVIDYESLGVAAGQALLLHVFPDRRANEMLRPGEPHLTYRSEALGELTSNSNMAFALPPDGGAYLLAVLGPGGGGTTDLAAMDIGKFPLGSGAGTVGRSLTATARHTYFFDFSSAGAFSLLGKAAVGLVASLYDPAGVQVARSDGRGNFLINQNLGSGLYTLVLSGNPGSGTLAYSLDYSSSGLRQVRPDVAVGLSPGGLSGVGVYGTPSGQTVILTSKKARAVSGVTSIRNTGGLPDSLTLSGTAGSSLFAVSYQGPAGNITAGLIAGTEKTSEFDAADSPLTIVTTITPNKKKLTKKRGNKKIILKKSHSTLVRATSTFDPGMSDFGILEARTR